VVTRPADQAAVLVGPLTDLGATVLVVPTIVILPVPMNDEVRRAVGRLGAYDLVVFTSANAVRHFTDRVAECLTPGDDGRATQRVAQAFANATIAAIGPRTAEVLGERGLRCDLVAGLSTAEGLIAALAEAALDVRGANVLIPRAREGRDLLPATLRERGARVDVVAVYETVSATELSVPPERIERADFVVFTSGSTVRQVVALMAGGAAEETYAPPDAAGLDLAGAGRALAERLAGARLCSIGPITSAVMRDCGLPVAAEAAAATSEALVAAVVAAAAG
jgi:uroporphyrinogen III methyltransferase/synthase